VRLPFSSKAQLETETLEEIVPIAVRLLDDVIDASRFPLPQVTATFWQLRRQGPLVCSLAMCRAALSLSSQRPRGAKFSMRSEILKSYA
jgi:ribonucleoside-diphosphate reductase alpha chain